MCSSMTGDDTLLSFKPAKLSKIPNVKSPFFHIKKKLKKNKAHTITEANHAQEQKTVTDNTADDGWVGL